MYDYISDAKATHRPSKVYGTNTNIPYTEITPNILDIRLAKSQYIYYPELTVEYHLSRH